MSDDDRQARLLDRYRHIVSGAFLIFLAWALYQAMKRLMFWAVDAFDMSGPDIESLGMFLSLPFVAAVWFSYACVMERLDKID